MFSLCSLLVVCAAAMRPALLEHSIDPDVVDIPWEEGKAVLDYLSSLSFGERISDHRYFFYKYDMEHWRGREKTPGNSKVLRTEILSRVDLPVSASAVRFCSALFQAASAKVPGFNELEMLMSEHEMSEHVWKLLPGANETCQEVLAGSLSQSGQAPRWAKEAAKLSETDGKPHPGGRLENVKTPAWKLKLREVCHDECVELVDGIKGKSAWIAGDLQSGISFQESCANRVVKRVEAHLLTCCGDACGWNRKAGECTGWAFLSPEDKGAWEAECCTEFNVLEGSEREAMCNSTVPEWQNSSIRRDLRKNGLEDRQRIGQDPEDLPSFFQVEEQPRSGKVKCLAPFEAIEANKVKKDAGFSKIAKEMVDPDLNIGSLCKDETYNLPEGCTAFLHDRHKDKIKVCPGHVAQKVSEDAEVGEIIEIAAEEKTSPGGWLFLKVK